MSSSPITDEFILVLDDVHMSDLESNQDNVYYDYLDNDEDDYNVYSKFPRYYKNFDDWVDKTLNINIDCIYSGLKIKNIPVPCAFRFKDNKYEVEAVAITFSCAASYNNSLNITETEKWNRDTYLRFIYSEFNVGKMPVKIDIVDVPKYRLKRHGGDLDDDEYYDLITKRENDQIRYI